MLGTENHSHILTAPFPPSSSSCPLIVPFPALCPFYLFQYLLYLHHIATQECVWSWRRQKQEADSTLQEWPLCWGSSCYGCGVDLFQQLQKIPLQPLKAFSM